MHISQLRLSQVVPANVGSEKCTALVLDRGGEHEQCPALPLATRKGGILIATRLGAFTEEELGEDVGRGMVGASAEISVGEPDGEDVRTILVVDVGPGFTKCLRMALPSEDVPWEIDAWTPDIPATLVYAMEWVN